MAVTKEPFVGFSYNGKHSSELGIKRVSDGSRFNENLLPTIQDKTVQVPGGDGTYYFGSYYTQRQFTVSFVFDSLTEYQLSQLKKLFGDKKIHDLIFDETPYKIYSAKVTGTATIKHIPFDETVTRRVYKGEGTVQFTCYNPYARVADKWIETGDYGVEKAKNVTSSNFKKNVYWQWNDEKNRFDSAETFVSGTTYYSAVGTTTEWSSASGLALTKGNYDEPNGNSIPLINPGDKNADFVLRLPFGKSSNSLPAASVTLYRVNSNGSGGSKLASLSWDKINKKGNDSGVYFDTKLNIIEGYIKEGEGSDATFTRSGNLYNECFKSGEFFKIRTGETKLTMSQELESFWSSANIEYDYWYF